MCNFFQTNILTAAPEFTGAAYEAVLNKSLKTLDKTGCTKIHLYLHVLRVFVIIVTILRVRYHMQLCENYKIALF